MTPLEPANQVIYAPTYNGTAWEVAQLTAMGHTITNGARTQFGGAQAIIRLPKGYAAGSDPRKDGMALGY